MARRSVDQSPVPATVFIRTGILAALITTNGFFATWFFYSPNTYWLAISTYIAWFGVAFLLYLIVTQCLLLYSKNLSPITLRQLNAAAIPLWFLLVLGYGLCWRYGFGFPLVRECERLRSFANRCGALNAGIATFVFLILGLISTIWTVIASLIYPGPSRIDEEAALFAQQQEVTGPEHTLQASSVRSSSPPVPILAREQNVIPM